MAAMCNAKEKESTWPTDTYSETSLFSSMYRIDGGKKLGEVMELADTGEYSHDHNSQPKGFGLLTNVSIHSSLEMDIGNTTFEVFELTLD